MLKRSFCLLLALMLLPLYCLADVAKVQTPGGGLNMRKEPDTRSKLVMRIPNKTTITVLEQVNEDWTKVEYKGKTGYVLTTYLNLTKSAEGKTVYTDATDAVFVREKPSDSSKIITALSYMSPLVVIEVEGDWTRVSCTNADGDTVEGYIRTGRIADQHKEPQSEHSAITMNEQGEMRKKQTLYLMPSTKAEVITTLSKGQKVTVLSMDGGWCRIRIDSVIGGYVDAASVSLTGTPAEPDVNHLLNYVAVYYTCTVPSGKVPVYVEPTSDTDGKIHRTITVDPKQEIKVTLRGQTSHGRSWSRIVVDGQVVWTLSSVLDISSETKTMYYNRPVANYTPGVVFAGKNGATMYASASHLTEKLCKIPAGTELEGSLRSDCAYVAYKGNYGYVFYDELIRGVAEVRDPDSGWNYWDHMDQSAPTPTPAPVATPVPDTRVYISTSEARTLADAALKREYSDFSAKNLRVVSERLETKRGSKNPVYEFAYYKGDKYMYNALIDAIDGSTVYTADYTDFGQTVPHATPKPTAPTTRPGEISYSEAKSIAKQKLSATYGGFGDVPYTLNNERFDSMPNYEGPVYRLTYFENGEHAYTCIVSAASGKVLYHADVADSSMTEIDYSTPTPAPTYDSQEDIGQSRARSIADSTLRGKYPDFAGETFSSVTCRFVETDGSFETPHYQFDYFVDGHMIYEIIVHAWTGKVLYSIGGLPGEGNG